MRNIFQTATFFSKYDYFFVIIRFLKQKSVTSLFSEPCDTVVMTAWVSRLTAPCQDNGQLTQCTGGCRRDAHVRLKQSKGVSWPPENGATALKQEGHMMSADSWRGSGVFVTRWAPQGWFKEPTPVFDFLSCVFFYPLACVLAC